MDNTNKRFCFTHPFGEDIYSFTLCNSKNTEVDIINYGAIITAFRIRQENDAVNDIVLGFDDPGNYLEEKYLENYPYFGAAIGRYGNRIKEGKFNIDGKEYKVDVNLGRDHLHGGYTGLDKRVWHCESFSNDSLVLRYMSKDGEEGYPGNLDITIKYELNDNNELSYEYTAFTDQATPINLTHHSYFNLDNGKGTIHDHWVRINGSSILEQDQYLTTTGNVLPVENTSYDFRKAKPLSRDWDPSTGYDQSFVADNVNIQEPAAEAWSNNSGVKLQVFTTEPIIHLYTGKSIPSIEGKNGHQYGPFSGFCLETQIHPNAINISSFPNTILRPGETYRHKTIYKVSLI
jgi:aldose 1-epimerase